MKSASRALGVVIVAFLCVVVLPFFGSNKTDVESLLPQDLALAASDQDYLKEPFAIEPQNVPDPWERVNRGFFKFNDRLYFWVLKPAALAYKTFVPEGIRLCIRNASHNVLMPVRVVNNLLQAKFESTGIELSRFLINSTLGLGGLFDFASTQFKLEPRPTDLGLTLGHYGMKPIMYIDWPFLGPSDVRDTIGLIGDAFLNPIFYLAPYAVSAGTRVGQTVNETSLRIGEYEDFKKSALDPYVSLKDAYLQYRARELRK
jgi:phospholipid-binding lipoprotein MlaA